MGAVLIQTRCTRGADIARQLRFSEGVADGIHSLDEHWNGQGRPAALAGDAIPLYARIALLAQVVDVVNCSDAQTAATAEVQARRGKWFDPEVVDAFLDEDYLDDIAEAFGQVVDAKSPYTAGHSAGAAVRRHASYTQAILGRIEHFDELARVSSAHHERLDSGGYPLGLKAADIALETRIITTADIFDAITAKRPYRGPCRWKKR